MDLQPLAYGRGFLNPLDPPYGDLSYTFFQEVRSGQGLVTGAIPGGVGTVGGYTHGRALHTEHVTHFEN